MSQEKDPVCGMMIDSETAAGHSSFQGGEYYFCSADCKQKFDSDPARYVSKSESSAADGATDLEQHEPPYTKTGGMVSPKFGAAGSGGAEYERLPEAHDRAHKDGD